MTSQYDHADQPHPPARVDDLFGSFQPGSDVERADLARIRALVAASEADPTAPSPWDRSNPLHLTGSALIVATTTGQVLLRWHDRQQSWLQVGGHGDPGEHDPLDVALREAEEETGLTDLAPWPDHPHPVHLVCVPVPAKGPEPAHEHADIRYLLTTSQPEAAVPESDDAPLRWLTFPEAKAATTEDNLRLTLDRIEHIVAG